MEHFIIVQCINVSFLFCNYLATRQFSLENALFAPVFAKIFSRRDARPCVPTSTSTKMPISYLKIGAPKQLLCFYLLKIMVSKSGVIPKKVIRKWLF